jgi:hypothetical protein
MGFLDDLFGAGAQRRDTSAATKAANEQLTKSKKAAIAALNGGMTTANSSLDSGYDASKGFLTTGYDTARGDITTGYDDASGELTDALGNVRDVLNPWIADGRAAQDKYNQALSLGPDGTAGADEFYQDYADNDPFRAFRDEMATKQLASQFNSAGIGASGRGALAVSRASLERGTSDLNALLDRYERQGTRGGQYATTMAGYENQAGQNQANLDVGKGTSLGNLEIGRGTSLADLTTGHSTAKANLATGNASDIANLEYGSGQQMAGNRIAQGNANAATRGVGANNLIKIAGMVLGAAAPIPGAGGASAFSNMASGANKLLGGAAA